MHWYRYDTKRTANSSRTESNISTCTCVLGYMHGGMADLNTWSNIDTGSRTRMFTRAVHVYEYTVYVYCVHVYVPVYRYKYVYSSTLCRRLLVPVFYEYSQSQYCIPTPVACYRYPGRYQYCNTGTHVVLE